MTVAAACHIALILRWVISTSGQSRASLQTIPTVTLDAVFDTKVRVTSASGSAKLNCQSRTTDRIGEPGERAVRRTVGVTAEVAEPTSGGHV